MVIPNVTASIQQATVRTSNTIRGTTASTISGLRQNVGGILNTVTGGLNQFSTNLGSLLKPVSTFLGGTLAILTGIMQDPLGSIAFLPRTIGSILERINPQFAANTEATFKKYKIDTLLNLPGTIIGGIRSLLTFADAVLSLPLIILQDIYNGLMEVMEAVNEIINGFLNQIYNFFFGPNGILDNIIPIGQILSFINEISSLASEIGGISGAFLGSNPITSYTLQVQGYANQIGSFIQNPFDTLFAYAPPQVSQALYLVRNPQQMINSLLPPQLSQLFAGVSKASGFGFNGNMGYGFGSVLNGVRGGVLSSILTNFSAQYPILTPLLGLLGGSGAGAAGGGNNTSLFTSPVNPNIKTAVGGIVQPQQIPQPVLPNGVNWGNVTTGVQGWNTMANSSPTKTWQTPQSQQGPIQNSSVICWVAREVYGVNNIKWLMFREWLLTSAPNWLLNNYIKHGEQFANWISNKPLIKSIIRVLMNRAIKNYKYI